MKVQGFAEVKPESVALGNRVNRALTSLSKLRDELNSRFFEREEMVDALLTALVAEQNILLIGAPGSAKTEITQHLASAINGQFFDILMTKFTVPDEVLGPVDIKKLKEGEYARKFDGYLATAKVVLLDEIWKASSAIANILLRAVNEKRIKQGANDLKIPLRILVGASNEYPQGDELAAIYDRFNIKLESRYVAERSNFEKLVSLPDLKEPVKLEASLSEQDLEVLSSARRRVSLGPGIVELLDKIWIDLRRQGIIISDRRWVICATRILRAVAVINGRDQIIDDDLLFLVHCLWQEPEQRSTVAKTIFRIVNPIAQKALELLDMGIELWNSLQGVTETGKWFEAADKIRRMRKELVGLKQQAAGVGKTVYSSTVLQIEKADSTLEGLLKQIVESYHKTTIE